MRTGSAAQLFGQLADLIDDRSNRLDRIEKRCIRRDINAGHFCQLFRCLRASGGQYLFPVIDSGLASISMRLQTCVATVSPAL